MRRTSQALTFLVALVAAVATGGPVWGCGHPTPAAGAPRAERVSSMLPIRLLEKGNISEIHQDRELVIRDAAEWQRFYSQHHPGGALPAVDFSQEMVVGAFLSRNTGGYRLTLVSVEDTGSGLRVTYSEARPGPGAIVIQVLTQPYVLAAVPRRDGDVQFVHQTSTLP